MCGIFGGIGRTINPGIIRALALINRERGTDSLGFFDNTGKIVKQADDPVDCLGMTRFNVFIERACKSGWFVAGHTRFATTGKVTNRNSHPFRFGRIVGAHNGMVSFPRDRNYQVDSEYLIDQLNRYKGDYQAALADVSGYWGLSWFDGKAFWLQAHDNEVYVGQSASGDHYYSSDATHLAACIGRGGDLIKLGKGATIRFDATSPTFLVMPDMRVTARWTWNVGLTGNRNRKHSTGTGGVKPAGAKDTLVEIVDSGTKDPVETIDSGWLGSGEYDELNQLAQEAGYSGADDFMAQESIFNEHQALSFLRGCFDGCDRPAEDPYAVWDDYVNGDNDKWN